MRQGVVSIIIPTHNEELNVEAIYKSIKSNLNARKINFELLFIDDSTDTTPEKISQIIKNSDKNARVKLIRLTRSFGQSNAIAAGLKLASGDLAIMMDADFQDPPEYLPEMYEKWQRGFDVVYVKRKSTGNFIYRASSRIFYLATFYLSSVEIPRNVGEFRLIDRKVIDFVNKSHEKKNFLRGLTIWPGYSSTFLEIQRPEREFGETNYNFRKSLNVALSGLISFSIKPLRLAFLLGALIMLLTIIAVASFIAYALIIGAKFNPGWLSLILIISSMFSLNFVLLGILGEYIGNIYESIQKRPDFVIDFVEENINE